MMRKIGVPQRYVLEHLQDYETVTPLVWQQPREADWEWATQRLQPRATDSSQRYYAREIRVGGGGEEREYPNTVTVVSPALWWRLVRAPESIVMTRELNLATLFAGASKIRRNRKVVTLVEGDINYLGTAGTARAKVLLRLVVARFVDVFVANSSAATSYLTNELKVPRKKIVEGWWLAGVPDSETYLTERDTQVPGEGDEWVFAAAGNLIPRKGFDLLLDAVARFRQEVGPCRLRIIGDGPEKEALEAQATRLGIADSVEFLGSVAHEEMAELLAGAHLFVFTTLKDLIGRVVVEALSVGTPVVVSSLSGAVGTLVNDGENGVVMDPRDPDSLHEALLTATDPTVYQAISEGARRSAPKLTTLAAADVIANAIERARLGSRG